MVGSGDSTTTIEERLDPKPPRLCQLNKLRSHNLFTGRRLKVVKEEAEHRKVNETIERPSTSQVSNAVAISPLREKRLGRVFKRLIGSEKLENAHIVRVNQADTFKANDPLAAGRLEVEARFCHDLHRCVRGTLIATIEAIMFLPLSECEQTAVMEMRYETIRSFAAYCDASVFGFTKRPRLPRQCACCSSSEEIECHTPSTASPASDAIAPHEEELPLEPVLLKNEVFLCCTVQRNRLVSGGSICPTPSTAGAQWFIIPRRSIKDLESFLISSNLGFASIIPIDNPLHEVMGENDGGRSEKSLNIPNAIGSLISRRTTLHFRSPGPSITSSQSYISRSLSRLMQRTVSDRSKAGFSTAAIDDLKGERRRHLSVGCSKELFSDHTAIDAGDEASSMITNRSTSSTPSFADEKEVFDMLRQSSLAWELVSEQEFVQRCVLAETEDERIGGCEAADSAVATLLSPPASLLQSCILSSENQIHELFEAIPAGAQFFDWSLTFSSELHGFSLKTLYRRCEDFVSGGQHTDVDPDPCHGADGAENMGVLLKHRPLSSVQQNQPCVLLIKDTTDRLMGAYLSCHPRQSRGMFYGTGETFVFHWISPVASPRGEEVPKEEITNLTSNSGDLSFKKYPWSRKNSFFVSGEPEVLLIGCSNASSALRIDENLNRGRSQTCETFDSPELTPSGDFFIHTIEVWSLG